MIGRLLTAALASAAAAALAACVSSGGIGNKSDSDAAGYNLQLGIAYLQQGNLPVAKDKLERARQQNPRDATTHGALALLYEQLGKDKEADAEFRTAQQLAPSDPEVSNNYAGYLCRKGRTDDGVQRFDAAAANRLYRTPWAAFTNAGVCLRAAKRYAEAQQRFERALQFRPDFGEAAFQSAELALEQRDNAAAQTRVDEFLKNYPATPDMLLLGWRIARANGDSAGTDHYAQRLSNEFPNSEQARALAANRTNPG